MPAGNIRIGTRESRLALWQATLVQQHLSGAGYTSELVLIKSEGDINTVTPLYQIGVQGIFTKSLDAALLNDRIDIAVHSMKDVPTQLAKGIMQASVLKRASHKDLLVYKNEEVLQQINFLKTEWNNAEVNTNHSLTIATSSIRRMAQWLNRYPNTHFENLRGNMQTRLNKLEESNWDGAIFAAAGLERIDLRPGNSIELSWMLPAPAQGAIMVVCRENDEQSFAACQSFNDTDTALCTKIERDFLSALLGGCSTPISGLAEIKDQLIYFKGNILSPDGKQNLFIEKSAAFSNGTSLGIEAASEILQNGGEHIMRGIRRNA